LDVGLLTAAFLAIETLLVVGVLLPLRLDRHPPRLNDNLAGAYGLDLRGLLLYLGLAVGLLAAYALALRVAARLRGRGATAICLCGGAVMLLTVLPAHPTYSSDLFHYVATMRVAFLYGANPHMTAPAAFPDDPLMALSGWAHLPSPYGPLWTWASWPAWLVSGAGAGAAAAAVALKAVVALATVVAAPGVVVGAERLQPGSGPVAAVAFGWSPVVVIQFGADGHNDAVMLLALAWAFAALAYGRAGRAVMLAGAAVLVKAAAVVAFVALLAWLVARRRLRPLVLGVAGTALVAVAAYAPWWAGPATVAATLGETSYFTNTPAALVVRGLGWPPESGATLAAGLALRAALLVVTVWLAVRAGNRPARLIGRIAVAFALAVTLLGGWYQPWYASWALLGAAVLAGRPGARPAALALAAGALLVPVATNFASALSGLPAESTPIDALAVLLVLGPLVAVLPALRWFGRSPAAAVSSRG
jgi:hypothetical protein